MSNIAKTKILLVVNPKSGGEDKAKSIQAIKNFLRNKEIELAIFPTTSDNLSDQIYLKKIYSEYQPKRVWIAGGDGTIKFVVEVLSEYEIIFGILPMGSSNGLAKDLEIPSELEEALEVALSENIKEIDRLLINVADKKSQSLHLSDLGLNAELIKNYQENQARGKMGYFLQAFPTLLENKEPFEAVIQIGEAIIQTQARVILIANAQEYGTGVVVNPSGKIDDGFFEIVIFKNLELKVIFKILLGNLPLEDDIIQIITTKKASIITNKPTSFQIDGEFQGQIQEVFVRISEKKIKVAVAQTE